MILFYSGLRAGIKVLIASVPDLCIFFTFIHFSLFFHLLLGPPGLNWLPSFASDIQWCDVVWQSRDFQMSLNTLYLLSPRL